MFDREDKKNRNEKSNRLIAISIINNKENEQENKK